MFRFAKSSTSYILIFVFFLNLVMILTIQHNWDSSMVRLLPLQEHVQGMTEDFLLGHLWLEESISGDTNIDVDTVVWQRFQSIVDSNESFLKHNSNLYSVAGDLELIEKLHRFQKSFIGFLNLAQDRFKDPVQNRVGSPMDEKFDKEFLSFLKLLSQFQEKIFLRIEGEIRSKQKDFRLILSLFLALNLPLLFFVYLGKKSRDSYTEEMTRMQSLLNNIINSMPSTIVGVDPKSQVIQWNVQAEKETGISAENAINKTLGEVFPSLEKEMENVRAAIKTREPIIRPKINENDDQQYKDLTIYPLITNGVEGAVIRIDDVTERVRMQETMVLTEKMLSIGGLAAGMAHEINNPLSIIAQSNQNARRRLSSDLEGNNKIANELNIDLEVLQAYLEDRGILGFFDNIESASRRSAEIVQNMLSFSSTTASERESCAIQDVVQDALKLAHSDYDLKKKHDYRNICINLSIPETLHKVSICRVEIQQVFYNILKNAGQALFDIKSEDFKPLIDITASEDENFLKIQFTDNGPGVPKDHLSRILEPFFTTKAPGVGTGLGLPVSYFIVVNRHQGKFLVESQVGSGTTFTICLPIKAN